MDNLRKNREYLSIIEGNLAVGNNRALSKPYIMKEGNIIGAAKRQREIAVWVTAYLAAAVLFPILTVGLAGSKTSIPDFNSDYLIR